MTATNFTGELLPKSRTLAKGITLEECHRLTGLPLSWLSKFRTGQIANPSVQRVELVYTKLSGSKLQLK